MKTKRSLLLISILLVFTLIFSACGNNASTPSNSTPSNTPQASQPEQTESSSQPEQPEQAQDEVTTPEFGERQLKITLDDTTVVYAALVESVAVDLFVEQLPFTIEMDTYIERNKRGPLPFVIDSADLHNIQYPFEIGDIIYYPPGPLLGIFYDHNGAEISAGYELIARMDEEGIAAFVAAPAVLTVTVELSE